MVLSSSAFFVSSSASVVRGLLLGLADDALVLLVRLGDEPVALVLAVLDVLVVQAVGQGDDAGGGLVRGLRRGGDGLLGDGRGLLVGDDGLRGGLIGGGVGHLGDEGLLVLVLGLDGRAAAAAGAPDSSSAMRLCASSSSFFRRSFSEISSFRRGSTSLSRKLSTSSMS